MQTYPTETVQQRLQLYDINSEENSDRCTICVPFDLLFWSQTRYAAVHTMEALYCLDNPFPDQAHNMD